mgnify:CR=1 FL=1
MQTVLIIIGIIVVALIVLLFVAKAKMKNTPLVADHEKIVTLTEQNFQQRTKNKVVLVDFWATWCGPCKAIAPVLDELSAEYEGKARIVKIDVDQNPNLAAQYGIRSIPTLFVFKNGEKVDATMGMQPKAQLTALINKHL